MIREKYFRFLWVFVKAQIHNSGRTDRNYIPFKLRLDFKSALSLCLVTVQDVGIG
tara:strand:+ start:2380 stop:2544 length:165 start_codon:yes stop_codon:yes gene_type:complete